MTKKKSKKVEKKLNLPKVVKKVKTKKVANTPGYYLCMGDNCHGQNITQVAKDCKTNAPSLTAKRVKKFKELTKAAKVIGKFAQDLEKVLPR